MVDVTKMPENAFGYVPTPALVAPIEFTMRRDHYERLGGYAAEIRSVADVLEKGGEYANPRKLEMGPAGSSWPLAGTSRRWPA